MPDPPEYTPAELEATETEDRHTFACPQCSNEIHQLKMDGEGCKCLICEELFLLKPDL